jgi:hypothetical protein
MSAPLDAGHSRDLATGGDLAWTVLGLVEAEAGDQRSVSFTDESGAPWPLGARVMVKLVPSGQVVPCRVANQCAGDGEGEWHPFTGGDEVIVLIPNGDEKNGGVIVGRLNQSFDVMPAAVAGQDVTQNTVAFKRVLAPYVLESGTSLILRVASTGAALTLDPTGNTYLSAGGGAALFMRSDAVSLQLADAEAAFQLDPADGSATILAGGGNTVFRADGAADSYQTAGTLSLSTGGNAGVNHAISTEAVLAIFEAFLLAASAAATAPPALVAFFAAFSAPGTVGALFTAAAAKPPLPMDLAAVMLGLAVPKALGLPGIGSQGVLID